MEKNNHGANSRTRLAEAQGPSLRKKRSFAQATGPRLDETANREPCKIRESSLRQVLLA